MPELIDELKSSSVNLHARRVYLKCLKAKKYDIAERIRKKYKIHFAESDRVVAFGMALMALKEKD